MYFNKVNKNINTFMKSTFSFQKLPVNSITSSFLFSICSQRGNYLERGLWVEKENVI